MRKHIFFVLASLLALASLLMAGTILASKDIAILNPAGVIASQQRDLLMFATLLMLVIVLPVFALTFWIAWKYRAGNKKAKYTPEWDHNFKLEALWWGLPCAIILVLAIVTWTSSHALEPTRALASSRPPLTIQVVALQWKWLFLYPEQQVASVNHVQFPVNRPVRFVVTSDAPMNSFWIPRLGGQIYAMQGMSTQLNLSADKPGTYFGTSANLSGEGFAGMQFTAQASSDGEFDTWVQKIRAQKSANLDTVAYAALADPETDIKRAEYAAFQHNLYDSIIRKYMPEHGTSHDQGRHDAR